MDAFTSRLFAGNPAAVVLLEGAWPSDALLLDVARENNLSETAYVLLGGGSDRLRPPDAEGSAPTFPLRWFTPEVEVDLCGHATLAAAHVLLEHGHVAGDALSFESASGPLPVRREGELLVMDFPARPPEPAEASAALTEALGAEPAEVHRSRDLLALFRTRRKVEALAPDMARLTRLDAFAVIATAPAGPDDHADFVSRFFAPGIGVPEDPVTGSAHATLAPFWAERLGRRELRALQLSRRGGELLCRVRGERVEIGGRAVEYLEGRIRLG